MIEPIELTKDTAVLRRVDYDALIEATRRRPMLGRWRTSGLVRRQERRSMSRSSSPIGSSPARTRCAFGGSIAV